MHHQIPLQTNRLNDKVITCSNGRFNHWGSLFLNTLILPLIFYPNALSPPGFTKIMTRTQPPAPVPLDEDISKWLHIEKLCPDEDDTTETIDDRYGQFYSPVEWGAAWPSMGSPASGRAVNPQSDDDSPSSKKRRRTYTSNKPSGGLATDFTVLCFPSDPARPEGKKKKRRDFTQQRRLEVAKVRKEGACLRCKIRRISVGNSTPEDMWLLFLGQRANTLRSVAKGNRAMPASRPLVNLGSRYVRGKG